jgi:serine/threonine-protein kinase SRK2
MYEYDCIRQLGKGSYGSVYLAQNRYTLEYDAVKIIKKTDIHNEIYNHALVRKHPNIIRLKKVYQSNNQLFILMEYIDGMDLFEKLSKNIKPFTEEVAKYYITHILNGLQHCHNLGVCHRDLKLENIIVNDNCVKICDFGFSSSVYYEQDPARTLGSLGYFARETILKKAHDGKKVDIWSVGVILFILVCGYYPFASKTDKEDVSAHLDNILHVKYDIPNYLSSECVDLIKKILVANPADRPTIQEILNHPWLL